MNKPTQIALFAPSNYSQSKIIALMPHTIEWGSRKVISSLILIMFDDRRILYWNFYKLDEIHLNMKIEPQ